MKAQHSSVTVEHYTPIPLINTIREVLGGQILLDPASCEFAQRAVQASVFYTADDPGGGGLVQPWAGPLFVNPPGKSASNPGGAAVWWAKLVLEWEAANRSWSAVFLGFSLELLQTAQSYNVLQPLDSSAYCIPSRRIPFDVSADEEAERLTGELGREKGEKKKRLIERRLYECLANPGGRMAGKSPTHGNILVCLDGGDGAATRFLELMKTTGYVSQGYPRSLKSSRD